MYTEPIDITRKVSQYLEMREEILALEDMGQRGRAGSLSQDLTRLHSDIASNIFFYNDSNSAARNVIAQFLKGAGRYSDLFSRKMRNGVIDNSHESIRCRAKIFNDPEEGNVKIAVVNGTDNVNFKVECHYDPEIGTTSDIDGEAVAVSYPLDRFRDSGEDPESIPFNSRAEALIRGEGLVPAYWTDGNMHRNHWFVDGISREEARELLASGPGDNKGGKYEYIAESIIRDKKEDRHKAILEMMRRIERVIL